MEKRFDLVILDWDGTLMDSLARISRCYVQAALDFGLDPPSPSAAGEYIGLSLNDSLGNLYPHLSDSDIAGLVECYKKRWLSDDQITTPLYPGVEAGLSALQDAGYLLAVATGKSARGLGISLATSGLTDSFVYTRCADQSRAKPHPQMVLDILDYTGLYPGDCVVVGDTTFDMLMAKSAGADSWGVGYGSHSVEQVQALSDFPVARRFEDVVKRCVAHTHTVALVTLWLEDEFRVYRGAELLPIKLLGMELEDYRASWLFFTVSAPQEQALTLQNRILIRHNGARDRVQINTVQRLWAPANDRLTYTDEQPQSLWEPAQ